MEFKCFYFCACNATTIVPVLLQMHFVKSPTHCTTRLRYQMYEFIKPAKVAKKVKTFSMSTVL